VQLDPSVIDGFKINNKKIKTIMMCKIERTQKLICQNIVKSTKKKKKVYVLYYSIDKKDLIA
jgi:RecG-like helicase